MFMPVTAEDLADVSLFGGMTDTEREAIAERSIKVSARPGIHLIKQGESGFEFFVVLDGNAEVRSGGKAIATLGPGDVFGEMALLETHRRTADVVATTHMTLATMMVWDFREMTEQYPKVAEGLRNLIRERTGS